MLTFDLGAQPHETVSGVLDHFTIAQTNIALYRKLHDLGYGADSLAEIRAAYELATALFAGRFRPCGRPFIAHLVGTASVLADLGAPAHVVAAGLLHAAYEQGDFGFTRWRNRRARVRSAIGTAVEDLVSRYVALKWSSSTIPKVSEHLDALAEPDRTVLLMRLANELDDHADFAGELAGKVGHEDRTLRPVIVEMAARLGKPRLAAALRQAFSEPQDGAWLAPLRTDRKQSYQLAWSNGSRFLWLLQRFPFLRYLPF